jgi:hypothetical protein
MANGVTELLNVPGGDGSLTIEFNGKKYTAGLITQKVKSGYEKIMEKKALDSIFKMKEFLDPVEFREAVSSVTRDIASGVYSFGSDRSIQSLSTPGGTITFSAAHNLSNGNSITISGATPSGWNGTWTVTVLSTTQVSITFVSAPTAYVSGATTTATTTASGPVFGGDELEMDGITVAANCTTAGTVNLYISAINGAPILGLRNFNYSIT